MMRHYLQVKEQYKDCVLFYRLGDFYEMFFEDAKEVSQLLDLTLTGRDCGLEERAPMCGIPYHAADNYIARLVALGKKVAICEQLTEPTPGRGMVERDVIRVVSAGTLIEENLLDEKKNNYIACAFREGSACALAWADITTGEFCARDFSGEDTLSACLEYLVKLSPAEVICNDGMLLGSKGAPALRALPAFSCYVPVGVFSSPRRKGPVGAVELQDARVLRHRRASRRHLRLRRLDRISARDAKARPPHHRRRAPWSKKGRR